MNSRALGQSLVGVPNSIAAMNEKVDAHVLHAIREIGHYPVEDSTEDAKGLLQDFK